MKEINQVAALRAESLFHLIGYPGCAITDTMNGRAQAKAGLNCTVKQTLSGCVNIALERAAKSQRLAPLRVCQTYFGLLPLQLFAFALVCAVQIGLHDGHHATVCFDNDHRTGARFGGPALRCWGGLEYLFGMSLGNAGNGAFTHHDTVVFHDFVHGLCEGLVSAEVGHYAL